MAPDVCSPPGPPLRGDLPGMPKATATGEQPIRLLLPSAMGTPPAEVLTLAASGAFRAQARRVGPWSPAYAASGVPARRVFNGDGCAGQ